LKPTLPVSVPVDQAKLTLFPCRCVWKYAIVTGVAFVYVIVTVAAFDTNPLLSFTVYWIGVGLSAESDNGVKVIAPLLAFTLHVPSPGTTSETPGPLVPAICTVVGLILLSASVSFPNTFTVTA
jgi:hypothetical protein